jgi:putative transposase
MLIRHKRIEGTYLKGYKIQIFPDKYQKAYIERCFELVRYVWNWSLEKENIQYNLYKEDNNVSKFLLDKELLALYREEKKTNVFLDFLDYESTRMVIRNLVNAYMMFFKKKRKHPTFKSKKRSNNYLPLRYDTTYLIYNTLKIPKLNSRILTNYSTDYKYMKDNPKYYNCKITKDNFGNYWFNYSLLENVNYNYFSENNIIQSEAIGIDLNLKNTICCSNGIIYQRPNLEKINKRIRRLNRSVYKDNKLLEKRQKELKRTNSVFILQPTNNARKRLIRLNKAYNKKKNIIDNFINQSVSDIIMKNPKAIVMEDLHVEKMLSKHYMAKKIYDCSFYNIRDRVSKKCEQYNIPLIIANRYFKSSQICSVCGAINKNHTDYHIYKCQYCGNTMDRDLNAAKNLAKLANTYSFETVA